MTTRRPNHPIPRLRARRRPAVVIRPGRAPAGLLGWIDLVTRAIRR